MSKFDDTGKDKQRLFGRYIISTTANILWLSVGMDNRFMTKIIDLPVTSKSKCFVIECDGILLYNTDVQEFEFEQVGDFNSFKFQNNSE